MLSVSVGIFFEVGWRESRALYSITSPASSLDRCIMHCSAYFTRQAEEYHESFSLQRSRYQGKIAHQTV